MAKYFEVMDHVHLVVVAEAMRNVQPSSLGRSRFGVECRLKTGNAGEGLRGQARTPLEPPFEVSQPQAMEMGERRNLDVPAPAKEILCGCCYTIA